MTTELTQTNTDLVIAAQTTLDRNPAAVYLASLGSKLSRRTMRGALNTIAELMHPGSDALSFPWHQVRFQHAQAVRSTLIERYSPATVNKMLASLRGALKAAWRLGLMDADDYQRAVDVKAAKGDRLPAGRAISRGELIALMTNCAGDPSPAGARDAALIAILYGCGLRRGEIVRLDLADFDGEAGELHVLGKGNKERRIPVVNGTLEALHDWLSVRGCVDGPLFLPIWKGGQLRTRRMTAQAVYHILKSRAQAAGVSELSPHDFRRTFVGDLLDAGADIVTVQHLAGHANVETTSRYDRRPEEVKRKAAELLHVPYIGRTE